jgi:hypothetical protein
MEKTVVLQKTRKKRTKVTNLRMFRTTFGQIARVEFSPLDCIRLEAPWKYYCPVTVDVFGHMFKEIFVPADGNCLFYALSMAYYERTSMWEGIKEQLHTYALRNYEETGRVFTCLQVVPPDIDKFFDVLRRRGAWGTTDHILLFMEKYNVPVYTWIKPQASCSKLKDLEFPDSATMSSDAYCCSGPPKADYPPGPAKKIIHILWNGTDHYSALEVNRLYTPPGTPRRRPNHSVTYVPAASGNESSDDDLDEFLLPAYANSDEASVTSVRDADGFITPGLQQSPL